MRKNTPPISDIKKILVIYYGSLNHVDGISNKYKQFKKILKEKHNIELDIIDTIEADFKLQSEIIIEGLPQHIIAFYTPKAYIQKFLEGHYDAVHIVEIVSPQSFIAARALLHYSIPFTMSSHINYEMYINSYEVPASKHLLHLYFFLTARHAQKIMVSSASMSEVIKRFINYRPLHIVENGIDSDIFNTKQLHDHEIEELERELAEHQIERPRPYLLCFSRIAPEKNLEAFFKMEYPGTKIMIGKGPSLKKYQEQYKNVIFLGIKDHKTIAKYCKHCDVFVFPSESETFGAVMIEASGCGLPVAALRRPGCVNAIKEGVNGYLVNTEQELNKAVDMARKLDRKKVATYSAQYTWDKVTNDFLNGLFPVNQEIRKKARDKFYGKDKEKINMIW